MAEADAEAAIKERAAKAVREAAKAAEVAEAVEAAQTRRAAHLQRQNVRRYKVVAANLAELHDVSERYRHERMEVQARAQMAQAARERDMVAGQERALARMGFFFAPGVWCDHHTHPVLALPSPTSLHTHAPVFRAEPTLFSWELVAPGEVGRSASSGQEKVGMPMIDPTSILWSSQRPQSTPWATSRETSSQVKQTDAPQMGQGEV